MKKNTLLLLFLTLSYFINGQILSEGFDDVTTLPSDGWTILNVSSPEGPRNWYQGDTSIADAHTGDPNSYIATNNMSANGVGQSVSNWLILPTLSLKNGDELSFYTRTIDPVEFPDRLQVRVGAGTSPTAPTNSTDLGGYTTLLLDINPTYLVSGPGSYPIAFTQYTATISGLGATPADARLAFRYFIEDNTNNSEYVGIDTVEVTSSTLSLEDLANESFNHFYDETKGTLTLKSPNSNLQYLTLYNMLGQDVLNKKLSQKENKVNIQYLNNGIYLAEVTLTGYSKTIKFQKH